MALVLCADNLGMKLEQEAKVEKTIFFLHFDEKLPNWFFGLSVFFNQHQVKLVPMSIGQLSEFTKNQAQAFVMTVVSNYHQKKQFEAALKGHLGFAIRHGSLNCYHVSSFENKNEFLTIKKGDTYLFFKLPYSMKKLADEVSDHLRQKMENSNEWPGGRRPRLSDEVVG